MQCGRNALKDCRPQHKLPCPADLVDGRREGEEGRLRRMEACRLRWPIQSDRPRSPPTPRHAGLERLARPPADQKIRIARSVAPRSRRCCAAEHSVPRGRWRARGRRSGTRSKDQHQQGHLGLSWGRLGLSWGHRVREALLSKIIAKPEGKARFSVILATGLGSRWPSWRRFGAVLGSLGALLEPTSGHVGRS